MRKHTLGTFAATAALAATATLTGAGPSAAAEAGTTAVACNKGDFCARSYGNGWSLARSDSFKKTYTFARGKSVFVKNNGYAGGKDHLRVYWKYQGLSTGGSKCLHVPPGEGTTAWIHNQSTSRSLQITRVQWFDGECP